MAADPAVGQALCRLAPGYRHVRHGHDLDRSGFQDRLQTAVGSPHRRRRPVHHHALRGLGPGPSLCPAAGTGYWRHPRRDLPGRDGIECHFLPG